MKGLVFLDFDGVICDSLSETLVSSWRGYYLLNNREEPKAVPVSLRGEFARLRPFVRSGEDFILIQECIAHGIPIHTQATFDEQLAQRGEQRVARFREAFYAARRDLLKNDRKFWIDLNRLYPHVEPRLQAWASSHACYILSTKRAEYIIEILESRGIHMDSDRVISCGAKQKKSTILRILDARECDRALFIDDQIDHLASEWARDPRIAGCLASWGYVQKEWLDPARGIEVLHNEELAPRVEGWLKP